MSVLDKQTDDELETADPTLVVSEDDQPEAVQPAAVAGSTGKARSISFTVRGLVLSAVIAVLAASTGVLGWLYVGAQRQLDEEAQQAANRTKAETVAIEYAVNAAEMDYQKFGEWKARLVAGTSPELTDKLTKAADSMEQVLAPLQWRSTARPLAATVRSNAGGIYTVDAFVSVQTKTVQAPEGLQSTATYSVAVDSRNDWLITDVGGVDAALGGG